MKKPFGLIESCNMGLSCRNSIETKGISQSSCKDCKYSPSPGHTDQWYPIDKKIKHPAKEQEKRESFREKQADKIKVRTGKDQARRKINRIAAKAEIDTNRETIRATKNSGRTNQDGDQIFLGKFALDTKIQTNNIHPIVRMDELEKIRRQARSHGYMAGALVLVNSNGKKVVVFALEDAGCFVNQEIGEE